MLLTLRTQNFRKLRDRTFTYGAGLNVVRGANEDGKSTMLEAWNYLFFGSKACREPLEAVVTWGEDVKSLRVEGRWQVEGHEYWAKRSKSGAELRGPDGLVVTGQTEVTAFIGRLFGTAPQNLPNLILSGQGDIRGALDRGPKAATELIEDLANFAIIDQIVTLIGEKLLTGSAAPFEEKVGRLKPELDSLEQALAEVPDTQAEEAQLASDRAAIDASNARMKELSETLAPVAAERDRLKGLETQRARLEDRQQLLERQHTDAVAALESLRGKPPAEPNTARADEIRSLLADVEKLARARGIRDEFAAFPPYTGDEWEADEAGGDALTSFNAEMQRIRDRTAAVQARLAELSAQAREARAKRIEASACGLCGKDVSELPEVKAKNDAIDTRLTAIAAEEVTLRAESRGLADDQRAMKAIDAAQTCVERLAARCGDLAAVNKAVVPWRVSYVGPAIPDNDTGAALRAELGQLVEQERAVTSWKAKVEAAEAAVETARAAAAAALKERLNPEFIDIDAKLLAAEAECNAINQAYADVASSLYAAKESAAKLEAEISAKRRVYDAAKAQVESVRKQLEEARADLASVNFNNALLKRVRAARPVIANKLWAKVLATVSRYFSMMRGDESAVTKDGDGFKVNGKGTDGLSGSTKDILGLAIRLALVRVFLPHAPFLVLDEPFASMDATRTAATAGFLSSAGFDQMLVVTHEETTEQVSASLIEM